MITRKDIIESNYENIENKYNQYVYLQFFDDYSIGHLILTVYIINGREKMRKMKSEYYDNLPESKSMKIPLIQTYHCMLLKDYQHNKNWNVVIGHFSLHSQFS